MHISDLIIFCFDSYNRKNKIWIFDVFVRIIKVVISSLKKKKKKVVISWGKLWDE